MGRVVVLGWGVAEDMKKSKETEVAMLVTLKRTGRGNRNATAHFPQQTELRQRKGDSGREIIGIGRAKDNEKGKERVVLVEMGTSEEVEGQLIPPRSR